MFCLAVILGSHMFGFNRPTFLNAGCLALLLMGCNVDAPQANDELENTGAVEVDNAADTTGWSWEKKQWWKNRARWRERRPERYEILQSGTCPGQVPPCYLSVFVDGMDIHTVAVDSFNQASMMRDRISYSYARQLAMTVDEAFEVIENALDDGYAPLAHYDSTFGYPTRISFDPEPWVTHDETNLEFSDFRIGHEPWDSSNVAARTPRYMADMPPPPPPPPEIIGGIESLRALVRYPEEADSIEGMVFVQFTVGEDGKVDDAQVLRGLGEDFDKEALRVVHLGRYRPAMVDGKPQRATVTIPIRFKRPEDR